jgi:pseudouridine synthase, rluA family
MLLKYIIEDNKNLRSILKDELNISSRLFNKIKNKYVFVNGEHAIYYRDLNVNDVVEVDFSYDDDNYNNIVSNPDIKFEIVYEDDWLLIVNKGANLPVHPSLNHYDISLSNGIRAYFDKIGLNKTVRLVNRIDKDTTGLVVIAKCEYIQESLIKQMSDNSFIKEYIAIARGLVDSSGVIDFPIARKDGSIIERCVDLVRGENAITNYVRLNYNPELDISLVKCRLLTGRTHQIRVHFAYIGHPLLGDSLYGLESGSSCNALCGGFGDNGLCDGFDDSDNVSDVKSGALSVGFSDSDDVTNGLVSVDFSDSDDISNLHDVIHGEVSTGVDLNGVMPGALSVGVNKCDVEKSRADLINHQALQSNCVYFIHPISKKVIDICLKIDGIYKELFE